MFVGPSVNLILAEFARVEGPSLTVIGGGVSVRDPGYTPMAIAATIRFPREGLSNRHHLRLSLVDDVDGPVSLLLPDQSELDGIEADLEPATGLQDERIKTPFEVGVAISVPPFKLKAGRSYAWQAQLDGETRPEWSAPFRTTPPEPPGQ